MALVGVAISLIIKSRDGRAAQATSIREFHRELIEMTVRDPTRMLPSWGWNLGDDIPEDLAGRIMFAHMIRSYTALGYELGVARFTAVADDEYRKAVAAGPPEVQRGFAAARTAAAVPVGGRSRRSPAVAGTAAGTVAGMVVVGAVVRGRVSRGRR